MEKEGKVKVVETPIDNAVQFVVMNEKMPPFDNVKVRRAIAYAIPYQKIMDVALYNKARPMFGGPEQITDGKMAAAIAIRHRPCESESIAGRSRARQWFRDDLLIRRRLPQEFSNR